MTPDILESPAVDLLLRLEREGYAIAVVDDRLLLKPIDRLSDDDRKAIRALRADLILLVRVCDDGVQARRLAFRAQLEQGLVPGRVSFLPHLPYVAGRCFSCGASLERPRHGKCASCALAWRLALGLSIPSGVAKVYDDQKVLT